MRIQLACRGCGQKLAAKESMVGKRVKCPKCGGVIQVPQLQPPAPEAEPDEYEIDVPDAGRPASSAPPPTGSMSDLLDEAGIGGGGAVPPRGPTKPCPGCQSAVEQNAVLCVQCGYHFGMGRQMETQRRSAPKPAAAPVDYDPDNPYAAGEVYDAPAPQRKKRRNAAHRKGPPWEQNGSGFDTYFGTVKLLLFSPQEMFSTMRTNGGLKPPLYFSYCGFLTVMLGYCVLLLLMLVFSGGLLGLLYAGIGILVFLLAAALIVLIIAPIILFVQAGVAHLALLVTGETRSEFETTFRVIGYSYGATLLVETLLGTVAGVGVVAFAEGMPPFVAGLVPFTAYLINAFYWSIGFAEAHEIPYFKGIVAAVLANLILVGLFLALTNIDQFPAAYPQAA